MGAICTLIFFTTIIAVASVVIKKIESNDK